MDYSEWLNPDSILNIYTGVTGIMIAIVIFIAEIVSSQNDELSKKVILSSTKIKREIILMLLVFLYMVIANIVGNVVNEKNIIYLIVHVLSVLFLVISIFKTILLFVNTLKLTAEKNYFNQKLEEYVKKRVKKLNKEIDKKISKKCKKNKTQFKDFFKSQKICFDDFKKIKDNFAYEPIYPIKSGIVENYDYLKLNEIFSYFDRQRNINERSTMFIENVVYIPNNIGKKVSKNEAVFYCLKEYENIFRKLNETIIYADSSLFIEDEIRLINSCLFNMASEYEEPNVFDENNRLYRYFTYLYENNLYVVKSLALVNIEEYYKKIYDNYKKNIQFAKFLDLLSMLAFSNDEYNDYAYINNIEFYLYVNQLKEGIEEKKTAYEFANNVIRFNLGATKKKTDIRYYDNLMSILLRFIICLMKKSYYDAVIVLLDNIMLEKINFKDAELDKYDVVNFQFFCGIVYCLVLSANHNKINNTMVGEINKIINYIKVRLVNLYDAWYVILYFKKYFDKRTCVQRAYNDLDLEFVDCKYKNIWSTWVTDSITILKELLFVFGISFTNCDTINEESISIDDKYFYESLLKQIENKTKTKLDNVLELEYDEKKIAEKIKKVIEIADDKEKEYVRKKNLDSSRVEKIKGLIKNNVYENRLIEDLAQYDKIKKSSDKLRDVLGFSQLVPRKLFFTNTNEYEIVAINDAKALENGIEQEYIKIINKLAQKIDESIEEIFDKIENLEEYVIILDYSSKRYFNKLCVKDKEIVYKNKKIPIIYLYNVNGIIILKQNDLPTINFCEYDDGWNSNFVNDSIYYHLIDCAKENEKRKEIIENLIELGEKRTVEELDNYLKEYCQLQLYLAYKITYDENTNIFRVER